MQTKNYAAQMLVVGFQRGWAMHVVAESIGISKRTPEDVAALHRLAPFMPIVGWQYSTPVQAYVSAQWPKLAGYLFRNIGDANKLLKAIPEIEKLIAKKVHAQKVSPEDVKEQSAIRKDNRAIHFANRLARDQQLSTQRGAWNVCKG